MPGIDQPPSLSLHRQALDLPPNIDHPAVKKSAAAYASLQHRFEEAREKHYALEQSRVEVEAADRAALAESIRRSKPDPGAEALEKLEDEIRAAKREVDALDIAAGDAESELVASVQQARDEWLPKREAAVDTAREAIAAAVDQLAAALDTFATEQAVAIWLADFPQRRYSPVGSYVPALAQANGTPYRAAEVVEALRALGEKPAPRPGPVEHLPLHEQRRAAGVAMTEAS